jgi:hypothetical protein
MLETLDESVAEAKRGGKRLKRIKMIVDKSFNGPKYSPWYDVSRPEA